MKKKYIMPAVKVRRISAPSILAGSLGATDVSTGGSDGGSGVSESKSINTQPFHDFINLLETGNN